MILSKNRNFMFDVSTASAEKQNILILIAHPADETLYFYEGIKQLSIENFIDILCLTHSSTSVRGRELQQAMQNLNINIIFRNISDKGIHTMLLNIESHIASALNTKKYSILITYPPHGSEKSHPYHIQCFHTARRLSYRMHLRFGFFSEKKITLAKIKPDIYRFNFLKNFRYLLKYAFLCMKIGRFPLKNLLEIKNEFHFLIRDIFRSRKYYLLTYYPKHFEKQSTIGLYMSQINSLIKMKAYLSTVEYLYLETERCSGRERYQI